MATREEWTASVTVSADHPCLAGHFPGRPIVPAVLLLDRVTDAVLARFPRWRLASVGSAKFLRPVLPETSLTLHLSLDTDSGRARFRCALAEGDAAVGELGFVPLAG